MSFQESEISLRMGHGWSREAEVFMLPMGPWREMSLGAPSCPCILLWDLKASCPCGGMSLCICLHWGPGKCPVPEYVLLEGPTSLSASPCEVTTTPALGWTWRNLSGGVREPRYTQVEG